MTGDEEAIRGVIADWIAATHRGDLDAVLDLMTDDVVFQVAGEKPYGKSQFEHHLRGMGDVRIDADSEILEVIVCGDWAFARTHLSVRIGTRDLPSPRNRDDGQICRSGTTLSVFKRGGDGRWRLARDANLLTSQ